MIISLLGYMGCGKTHVAKMLSRQMQYPLLDLDACISQEHQLTIPQIFEQRGEIYFRKQEKEILHRLLQQQSKCILSVGGGTPVFYDNMETLNASSETVFLRTSVNTLAQRLLKNKERRPLLQRIADEDLPEFIAKHLFERNGYYAKAKYIVDTDGKTPEEIAREIQFSLIPPPLH